MNLLANQMDEDAWADAFMPIINPRDHCLLFDWTEPLDLTFLGHVDPHHVWTEVDMDDGDGTAIIPGRQFVNRIGYLVTMAPWTDDQLDLEVICDPGITVFCTGSGTGPVDDDQLDDINDEE